MSNVHEFRRGWRALISASLGLASGYTLNLYVANVFAPYLIDEFGWDRSRFALLGTLSLVGVITLPIVGRLTDLFGARKMIAVGVMITPAIYLAFAAMSGSLTAFFALSFIQIVTGAVTSSLVYSRLIAMDFEFSRGKALAIAATAAPAAGAFLVGPLSGFIEANGWRAGYLVMAAMTAFGGGLAFLLLPRSAGRRAAVPASAERSGIGYREILRMPAFRYIAGGMLLCNLTVMVQATQLQLLLLDRGVALHLATQMLSLYAAGVVVGRLCCGLALDRFPTSVVATLAMGLPCIGLAMLGFGLTSPPALATAILSIGLAMGAELDVLAYVVMRYFKVQVYSTVYGLIQPIIAVSQSLGSAMLGLTLAYTESFSPFLFLAALSTLLGSFLFLGLGRCPPLGQSIEAERVPSAGQV